MMTGRTLIRAINISEKDFPRISEIPLFLYDSKNRLNTDSDIIFEKELFFDNSEEKESFISLLNDLEKNKMIVYLDVQITESHVIVFSKTSNLKIFSRKPN